MAEPLTIVTEAGDREPGATIEALFPDELAHTERKSMEELLTRLQTLRWEAAAANARALASVDRLRGLLPQDVLMLIVARLDGDIRDLPGLHALAPFLVAERG